MMGIRLDTYHLVRGRTMATTTIVLKRSRGIPLVPTMSSRREQLRIGGGELGIGGDTQTMDIDEST